jgi:ABC-type transporter Mla maintaining outer membrane lipid asymmetry permease subunit MlaE
MPFVASLHNTGKIVLDVTEGWGRSWLFLARILRAILTPPLRFNLILFQLYQIGVNSTPAFYWRGDGGAE